MEIDGPPRSSYVPNKVTCVALLTALASNLLAHMHALLAT
jgi:hypothetical protein